jgi:hypothetical protein
MFHRNLFSPLKLAAVALIALFSSSCNKEVSGPANLSEITKAVDLGSLGSGQSCVTLLAGQHINSGNVCITDEDTNGDGLPDRLVVTYTTHNGWMLDNVKFWIGATLAEMPQNNNGTPKLGQFPYKADNVNGTSHTFYIPFADIGYSCYAPVKYFAVANATVTNGGQSEGAWADGDRLVASGNWAMYFNLWISCEEFTTDPVSSETAWAHDASYSTCFTGISGLQGNNWGWTNGPLEPGTYTMDLIAAAGQCNGGTLVGTVHVDYDGSSATVTVNASGANASTGVNYALDEAHIYVGNAILPLGNNGSFTTAPGQLGHNSGAITGSGTYSTTVHGLSGNIHVAVHAVVSGFPL